MGGPTRRQRSTSTSTRKRARRQCSWGEQREEEAEETTFHGLSPVLFWLLATSSLIVVINPPSSPTSPPTPSHRFDPAQFILSSPSPFSKMFHQNNDDQRFGQEDVGMDQYQMASAAPVAKNDYFFPIYPRPQGLRYRDDSQFFPQMMPILTEHRSASPFGRHPHHHHPAGPSSSSSSAGVDPSIADLDRIDIGWRCDLEGDQMMTDQYESDLQTLTEKSTVAPLTDDENKRYEEMSKNYYHGFYDSFAHTNSMNNNDMDSFHPEKHQQASLKQDAPERSLPEQPSPSAMLYDKDLLDLLEGTREGGELDMLFEDNKTSPVLNNVSLADAIVHTQANLTESRELQEQCNQLTIGPITPTTSAAQGSSSHLDSLLNMTDPATFEQFRQIEQSQELFPHTEFGGFIGMQNDSLHAVISNGQPNFDHQYSSGAQQSPLSPIVIPAASGRHHHHQQQQQTSTQTSPNSAAVTAAATASLFDSYQQHHTQRHSFSDCNTDSSSTCSRLSSESPRYNSESSTASTGPLIVSESRFYGKLVPARGSRFERPSTPRSPGPHKIGRLALSAGQRKRGRQSKDEQLASENALPVTALAISEMTLSELQNVLKKEDLSEFQRQLIRKIRRRGKNKVAARTCRQRRTDRHDKAIEMVHFM